MVDKGKRGLAVKQQTLVVWTWQRRRDPGGRLHNNNSTKNMNKNYLLDTVYRAMIQARVDTRAPPSKAADTGRKMRTYMVRIFLTKRDTMADHVKCELVQKAHILGRH